MQLVEVVVLLFLLLYYYYICRFDLPPSVPKPTEIEDVPGSLNPTLTPHAGNHYHFRVDRKDWHATLPDQYDFRQGRIVPQDACTGLADGSNIPASGPQLYQYLQRDELVSIPQPTSFEADATSTLQDKRMFYFSCRHGQIHHLHMCPPGQIFRDGNCQPINMCLGQPDGIRFPDPYNVLQYYECRDGSSQLNDCPVGTHFIHDECKDYEIGITCPGGDSKILDSKTLLTCDGDSATFETCPPGFQYFDTPHCENSACVGQLDGTKLALPMETEHSIQYSPGFMTCQANRVANIEMCPKQADLYLSPDQLSFLPQVFDGQACTAPILCTNVTPTDSNIVVPVADFTKHVSEWSLSKHYDRVVGTRCQGTTRIQTPMQAGQRIHPTLLKPESACDATTKKAIVAGFDKYYDCDNNSVVPCAKGEYFNGETCVTSNPRHHKHHNVDVFSMEPLSKNNWIKPWDYLKKEDIKDACSTPGYVLNKQYNVCIHPDCQKYPFLSKTPFKIGLRDSSECVYQADQIDKVPTSSHYLFWSQRQVTDSNQRDSCIPGTPVQSGNFVIDSTLYATCDEDQPFVFCPPSFPTGINKRRYWHCIPPRYTVTIPPKQTWTFAKNEVIHVYRYNENKIAGVLINNRRPFTVIPKDTGIDLTARTHSVYSLETHEDPVKIVLQYMLLHPPNTVFQYDSTTKEGIVRESSDDHSFLMKLATFTKRPLALPEYKIQSSLAQYGT